MNLFLQHAKREADRLEKAHSERMAEVEESGWDAIRAAEAEMAESLCLAEELRLAANIVRQQTRTAKKLKAMGAL